MTMNDNATNTAPVGATRQQVDAEAWRGMTLDELRLKRMMALVKREVGRERINHVLEGMRDNVNQNGVRGLLFSGNTISGLKTADYMLLGWRATRLFWKLWKRRK